MRPLFAALAITLTVFNGPVFASVGGPFDDGFNSAQLNDNAVLQAIINFPDGSGFCYYSPEANIVSADPTVPATAARGTMQNRMVLYYKGITYIGSALGTIDEEARTTQCSLNGGSEASATTSSSSSNSGFFNTSSSSTSNVAALTSTILSSSASDTVNGNFTAHVYQTSPTLRFKGNGQLAFLSPSSAGSVAGLAFSGFSGLINAIVTAVGNANVGQNFDPNVFTSAQQAIQNALVALPPLLANSSLDATFAGADVETMTVYGFRMYQ